MREYNRENYWFFDSFGQKVGFVGDMVMVLDSTDERIFILPNGRIA
jgi:hypothetical protein